MLHLLTKNTYILATIGVFLLPLNSFAHETDNIQSKNVHSHSHEHNHNGHSHHHSYEDEQIHKGYFKNEQVKQRSLADWQGDWQSVHPYLAKGALDPVFEAKSKDGLKSAEEYRQYYQKGYETNTNRITIKNDNVTFYQGDEHYTVNYMKDGYEILNYAKGNRGVRFIFKKVSGSKKAPEFIQFSDHNISPTNAEHFHIFMGNNRKELLNEMENWSTYYPSSLNSQQIVEEMLAH